MENKTLKKTATPDLGKILRMRSAFEISVRTYCGYGKFWKLKSRMTPQAKSMLWRACQIADGFAVDYHTYVAALFQYEHTKFRRAPRLSWLSSERTQKNVPEALANYTDKRIVRTYRATPQVLSRDTKFARSEKMLQTLMKRLDKTEKDVLQVYAKGTHAQCWFDKAWLLQHPCYQQLKLDGTL